MVNRYIEVFNSIFDLARIVNTSKTKRLVTKVKEKKILWFKKSVEYDEEETNDYRLVHIEQELTEAESLFPLYYNGGNSYRTPMTFSELWEFCEFIYYAESVIFYTNQSSNHFFILLENDLGNNLNYYIIIKEEGFYEITIKLEKVIERRYGNSEIHIIHVDVRRLWEDGFSSSCVLTGEQLVYEGDDPTAENLIKNISDIVFDECYNTFKKIINSMIGKYGVKLE